MIGVWTPIYIPKQIEGLRSRSWRAYPALAVSPDPDGFRSGLEIERAFKVGSDEEPAEGATSALCSETMCDGDHT
jgi:hypothetical protein